MIQMKQAIWALYYHKVSTDEDPKYGLCPRGKESWCKFQRAVEAGEMHKHKNSIPLPIMKFIKPVFESLS